MSNTGAIVALAVGMAFAGCRLWLQSREEYRQQRARDIARRLLGD